MYAVRAAEAFGNRIRYDITKHTAVTQQTVATLDDFADYSMSLPKNLRVVTEVSGSDLIIRVYESGNLKLTYTDMQEHARKISRVLPATPQAVLAAVSLPQLGRFGFSIERLLNNLGRA